MTSMKIELQSPYETFVSLNLIRLTYSTRQIVNKIIRKSNQSTRLLTKGNVNALDFMALHCLLLIQLIKASVFKIYCEAWLGTSTLL